MKNTLNPCGCSGGRINITAGDTFPTNPKMGDIHFDENGTIWKWNGISWIDNGTIEIQAGLPYFGDPSLEDVPSPAEGDGFWIVTEPGVYTNFGGVELEQGQFMGVISRKDGVYTIKPSSIDLSGYLQKDSVINNLTSEDIDKPLSANQGKILNDKITAIADLQYDYTSVGESQSEEVSIWGYLSSTFSKWGSVVGAFKGFNSVKIKVQAFDSNNPINNIRVIVRLNNASGTIVADKTVNVTVPINVPTDVYVVFDTPVVNVANAPLWVAYMCDGRCGMFFQNNVAGSQTVYGTDMSLSTQPSTAASSQDQRLYVEFLNAVQQIGFTETALNSLSTYMEEEYNIQAAELAYKALEEKIDDSSFTADTQSNGVRYFETGTFTGWGSIIGNPAEIDFVQIPQVRFYNSSFPVTLIRVVMRKGSYTGEILRDVTVPFNYPINELHDVLAKFAKYTNTDSSLLWVEYHTNGRLGMAGSNLFGDTGRYTVSTDINANFSDSSADISSNISPWIRGGILSEKVEASDEFLEALKEQLGLSPGGNVNIILPSRLYALQGVETNLYYANIIEGYTEDLDIDITCSKGRQLEKCFRYLPTSTDGGSTSFSINIYRDGQLIGSKSSTLYTALMSAGTGLTRKINAWGDSTMSAGQPLSIIISDQVGDPMTLQFVGTKGTAPNQHEGRSGYKISDYATVGRTLYQFNVSGLVTPPSVGSVWSNNSSQYTVDEVNITEGAGYFRCRKTSGTNNPLSSGTLTKVSGGGPTTIAYSSWSVESGNPMWNSTSQALDYAYYMAQSGITMVANDWFLFDLGINDMFGATDDTSANNLINTAIVQLRNIFSAVHAAVSGIRVGLCIAIPPTISQDGFGANYNNGQTLFRYLRNIQLLQSRMINEFDTDAERALGNHLIHIHAAIDRENNFPFSVQSANSRTTEQVRYYTNGVHPAQSGYDQLGDSIRSFIKYMA